jgi:hypothetical protein
LSRRRRLVGGDRRPLLDAPGGQLNADMVRGRKWRFALQTAKCAYLVGPQLRWTRHGQGADLVERYGARIVADPYWKTGGPAGQVHGHQGDRATARLEALGAVLLKALRTRGVRATT